MKSNLKESGNYEIFRTTENHHILRLDNEVFAIVKTRSGSILVKTDEDLQKQETLQEGQCYLLDSEEDISFKELPHLFIDKEGSYQEFILPSVSTDAEKQKKVLLAVGNERNTRHHIKFHEKAERIKKDTNREKKELLRTARKQHDRSPTKNNQKELLKASGQIKE